MFPFFRKYVSRKYTKLATTLSCTSMLAKVFSRQASVILARLSYHFQLTTLTTYFHYSVIAACTTALQFLQGLPAGTRELKPAPKVEVNYADMANQVNQSQSRPTSAFPTGSLDCWVGHDAAAFQAGAEKLLKLLFQNKNCSVLFWRENSNA